MNDLYISLNFYNCSLIELDNRNHHECNILAAPSSLAIQIIATLMITMYYVMIIFFLIFKQKHVFSLPSANIFVA